jgi:hypothetical protein
VSAPAPALVQTSRPHLEHGCGFSCTAKQICRPLPVPRPPSPRLDSDPSVTPAGHFTDRDDRRGGRSRWTLPERGFEIEPEGMLDVALLARAARARRVAGVPRRPSAKEG